MNKQVAWTDKAWEEYIYWQTQDRKTLKRINNIIKDVKRDSFAGIGKPEPLRHRYLHKFCYSSLMLKKTTEY